MLKKRLIIIIIINKIVIAVTSSVRRVRHIVVFLSGREINDSSLRDAGKRRKRQTQVRNFSESLNGQSQDPKAIEIIETQVRVTDGICRSRKSEKSKAFSDETSNPGIQRLGSRRIKQIQMTPQKCGFFIAGFLQPNADS